jgi:signal transduction histidine kinase
MTEPSEGLLKEARTKIINALYQGAFGGPSMPLETLEGRRLQIIEQLSPPVDEALRSVAEQAREERTREIIRELRTKIAAIRARLDTPEGTTQYRMQLLAQAEVMETMADELERTYLKK